ncbi:hypothetical protein M378DRAFT_80336 [Amanita muscaria Koide BX008]|uniref:Uncharacterized protein n=1 Tax=Amanita muscaria (strain Koide BX008) TaxID=946122 RepID=A0A0C2X2V7_AMAMK|nr:hypothetical protein M378DRAFT_80336 [Amanita muscaria Koide BX008]
MPSLTDAQSYLVAVFTQALLYGIYIATLIQCFRWLIFSDEGWKLREKTNSLMVFAVIFIFVTSTIYLVTSLQYEINEYTRAEDWNQYGTVMAMVCQRLMVFLQTVNIIYRCWVVYSKSWHVICVPVIFWLASLACSVLFLYAAGLNYKGQTYSTTVARIGLKALIGLYACNIVITVYTTTAIIYRIFSTRNASGGKRLNYVMRILAESGILYTSTIIFRLVGVLLVTGNSSTWVEWVIAGISDSIVAGITFNLILIRVYQSRVELQDSLTYSSGERALSGTHFNDNDLQITPQGSSFNALDEAKDEIKENRRSRDGMHEH